MLYKNGTWVELKGERVREQAWQDIGHGSLISSVSREILPPWNFQPICFFSGKFQVIPECEYCEIFSMFPAILLKASPNYTNPTNFMEYFYLILLAHILHPSYHRQPFSTSYSAKAITYNERPKMKRDAGQKNSIFFRKMLTSEWHWH